MRLSKISEITSAFRRVQRQIIVIEFGASYIKTGLFKTFNRTKKLTKIDIIDVSNQSLDKNKILSDHLTTNEYADCTNCYLILPQNRVSVKNMTLPTTDMREINKMVSLQAQIVSPFQSGEYVSDFHIIDKRESGQTDVLLFSANERVILEQSEILENAGKSVISVIPSSLLVAGFAEFHKDIEALFQDNSTSVIDIDYDTITLLVFKENSLLYLRSISHGVRTLGAEDNLQDENDFQNLLIGEIEGSFSACREHFPEIIIDNVVISGSIYAGESLCNTIKNSLDISCHMINPENDPNLDVDSIIMDNAEINKYSLSSFLGINTYDKLFEVNLLPSKIRQAQRFLQFKRLLLRSSLLILLNIVMVVFYLGVKMSEKEEYLDYLNNEIEQSSDMANKIELLKRQINLIHDHAIHGSNILDIIFELHQLTPSAANIEYFDYSTGRQITIKGWASRIDDVLSFVDSLKVSPYLIDAKMDYTKNTERKSSQKVQYQISAIAEKVAK